MLADTGFEANVVYDHVAFSSRHSESELPDHVLRGTRPDGTHAHTRPAATKPFCSPTATPPPLTARTRRASVFTDDDFPNVNSALSPKRSKVPTGPRSATSEIRVRFYPKCTLGRAGVGSAA